VGQPILAAAAEIMFIFWVAAGLAASDEEYRWSSAGIDRCRPHVGNLPHKS
jgi:hypothetical protein